MSRHPSAPSPVFPPTPSPPGPSGPPFCSHFGISPRPGLCRARLRQASGARLRPSLPGRLPGRVLSRTGAHPLFHVPRRDSTGLFEVLKLEKLTGTWTDAAPGRPGLGIGAHGPSQTHRVTAGQELSCAEPRLPQLCNGHENIHLTGSLGAWNVSWHGKGFPKTAHEGMSLPRRMRGGRQWPSFEAVRRKGRAEALGKDGCGGDGAGPEENGLVKSGGGLR